VPALNAAYAILAIENVVCAAILGQDRVDAGHRLRPATCLLATRAIANASQDGSPDDLEFHFAAAARCRGGLIGHFVSPSNLRRLHREVSSLVECPENCPVQMTNGRTGSRQVVKEISPNALASDCCRLRPRPY
jgi:hypothetical protein